MPLPPIDWLALARLRAHFLGDAGRPQGPPLRTATPKRADYWTSASDLASYDATFGTRIRWKWDHVLDELVRRGWSPPPGALLDWGAGTGVAARAALDAFGSSAFASVHVLDRSELARAFATARIAEQHPGANLAAGPPLAPELTLLVSHVLGELDESGLDELLDWLARAAAVIWVEPGTFAASRGLVRVRERFRESLHVVSPCTHEASCGLLVPGREPDWCHQFARVPPEAFTERRWREFGERMGIDLRSLPVSHLVLDRRAPPALPPGATRLLGRARVEKGRASLLGCAADGVAARWLRKRTALEAYKRARDPAAATLMIWRRDGDELIDARPVLEE